MGANCCTSLLFLSYQDDDDDDDEEIEDKMIKPTDYLIVCAHSDEDIFSLQASLSVCSISDFVRNGDRTRYNLTDFCFS